MLSVQPRFLRRLVVGGSVSTLALLLAVVVAVHTPGQAQTTSAFASRVKSAY